MEINHTNKQGLIVHLECEEQTEKVKWSVIELSTNKGNSNKNKPTLKSRNNLQIAQFIKLIRTDLCMNVKQFARLLGMDINENGFVTVMHWESGLAVPYFETIWLLNRLRYLIDKYKEAGLISELAHVLHQYICNSDSNVQSYCYWHKKFTELLRSIFNFSIIPLF